jgi:succinate-acetate transporter protein
MSVESDVQSGAHASAEPAAAAAPAGNPVPLALATFLPGALCLGLWLVGYLPAGDLGFIAPAVLASSGLFLLISTVWAARLGASPVAAILGTFAAFWLSLGFLVAAMTNGWLGFVGAAAATDAAPASNPLPTFLLAWLIVFVLFTVATLRLPLAFTAGFLFVDIAVALVLANALTGTALYATLAGIAVFIFCAIYAYILFDAITQETGGKAMSLGNPIQH